MNKKSEEKIVDGWNKKHIKNIKKKKILTL